MLYPLRDRNNDTLVTFSMPAVSRSWFLSTVLPKKKKKEHWAPWETDSRVEVEEIDEYRASFGARK